ncbi:MAG: hypothetical protein KGL16_07985 [Acidobacteriota bacterium]|nr:hypothetical protein [Acidobacteriota bacterium]
MTASRYTSEPTDEQRPADFTVVAADPAAILWLSPKARERLVFLAVAAVMIIGGGLVAAINGAASFAHGSWLAAYLVLVGGVAQLALGFGCLLLPRAECPPRLRRAQLWLWNVGILTVAAGVLTNLFGLVLTGSVVTATGLASFAGGGGRASNPGRNRVLAYRLVIGALAISVLVGGVLAHGTTS